MRFRYAALICLSGLAACDRDNEPPPQTAYDATEPTRAGDAPAMQPASLEQSRTGEATGNAAPSPVAPPAEPNTTAARSTTEPANPSAPAPAAPGTAGAQPDNTKVNERDRNTGTLTPGDQNNNENDLKITQQIRQAVMNDGSLSFTAKNVKIITQGGKVTLRGPVKTAEERSAIEAAARKVAGANQVDNQIEVKK